MAVTLKTPRVPVAPKEHRAKATKSELAAILKGEAAAAQGEVVTLAEFLHEMDHHRRKAGVKTDRKVSR